MHRRGHAHAAPQRAAAAWPGTAFSPADGGGALVHAFLQARAADVPAVHRSLAAPDGVASVDLHRVQAEQARHRVDVAVQGEEHLRAAEAAEGPVWRVVGVGERGVAAHVRQPVHVVAAHGADVHDLGTQAAVGAAVGEDAHVLGHDQALARHAQRQVDALRQAAAGAQEVLDPAVDQAHRPAGAQGQQRGDERVGVLDDLGPEAAAHRGGGHADARHRPLQRGRQARPSQEDRLRGCPDLQPAVGVEHRHRGHRLQVAGVLGVGAVARLVHHGRLRQGRVHVAAVVADAVRDVVMARMHLRRAVGERELGVQQRGLLLVLHADQVQRVQGDVLADGGHRRHLLAAEAHLALGQDVAVLVAHAPARARSVVARHDRLDPGQRARRTGVDAADARSGVRAAQHLAVQHAGQLDVARVQSPAEHLGPGVHLRRVAAEGRFAHARSPWAPAGGP